MGSEIEKYSRRGLRTSYVSTIVGISLVLFLIGLILGTTCLEALERQEKKLLVEEAMNEVSSSLIDDE